MVLETFCFAVDSACCSCDSGRNSVHVLSAVHARSSGGLDDHMGHREGVQNLEISEELRTW